MNATNATNASHIVTTLSPIPAAIDNSRNSWFNISESLVLKLYDAVIGLHTTASTQTVIIEDGQAPSQEELFTTLTGTPALFNYFLSPYAGACMALAVVLNRTVTYAQRRQSINLRSGNANNLRSPFNKSVASWSRIALRLVMLVCIVNGLLQTLLQYAIINKDIRPFIDGVGFLQNAEIPALSSFLWNTFVILGASQFLETLIASASGTSAAHDSGFTLFEQSLAFHEVQLLKFPNEHILIIVTFSLLSQFLIHATALLKLSKYQLIPSTVVSLAFLSYYVRSLLDGSILDFPSIAIVSVIPQLMVIGISVMCFAVYSLAVVLANGKDNLSITPVIDNLFQTLNLQLSDDFNSSVMKLGYVMFTTATDEEYVHQMSDVVWRDSTYLEETSTTTRKNGYLREYPDDPEFASDGKAGKEASNVDPLVDKFWRDWSLFRKFINIYRLGYGLVLLVPKIYRLGFKKARSVNIENQKTGNGSTDSAYLNNDEDLDEDYLDDNGSDFDPEEFDSDYESEAEDDEILSHQYISTANEARSSEYSHHTVEKSKQDRLVKVSPLQELFSAPESIISLLKPVTPEEITLNRTVQTHLESETRLTRSKFCLLDTDEPLKSLIFERRQAHKHVSNDSHNTGNDDEEEQRDMSCAVCRCAPRSIIIWPCRCFAICDGCRLGLGVRGFKICCCCRGPVEGFSKVYLP
ncbi:hypothetical protein WICPIJ_001326 [Wickerhamomyces pijperi]|uniref:Uncharacterized protein n=1 Tax=Wickerhamomyces pijperi TaxID=599730 RepID=A0A9P8QBV6_WICPI|nr:hypothetical protein WICPIJ_001326 [Wickerhamomyces pijperi]